MSTNELNTIARDLKELRLMADQLDAEIKTLEDAIKAHMSETGVDILSLVLACVWQNSPVFGGAIFMAAASRSNKPSGGFATSLTMPLPAHVWKQVRLKQKPGDEPSLSLPRCRSCSPPSV